MKSPPATKLVYTATLAALLVALFACGGGSHGGGIGGTGIVFGSISGLGTLIVDDVEFDTATAIVTRNGEPASEAVLALGMIVTVVGQLDADGLTGIADTIEITTLLEGPIERVATDLTTATVLGGTIVFSIDTVVDNLSLDAAAVGSTVEVSGFIDASGNIRVTRISGITTPVDFGFAVGGTLENVDTAVQTFEIRGVTIDYSSASQIDLPMSGVEDGLEVRAILVAPPTSGMAEAARVRFFARSVSEQADHILKLEGIITTRLAPRRFVLGGRRVFRITDATRIVGGTRADLGPDIAVSIVGAAEDTGIVRADRVELRGPVATVPAAPVADTSDRAYYRSF